MKPAFEAFLDQVVGVPEKRDRHLEDSEPVPIFADLAAFLAGMRMTESAELPCEHGTFEIVRDR